MSAIISVDGMYRYYLHRLVVSGTGRACWIMLNPSTADAVYNDPTINRVIDFTRRFGCREVEVVNLYAYRTSKPTELWNAYKENFDIVGPENDTHIMQVISRSSLAICAWGAIPVNARKRAQSIIDTIRNVGKRPYVLKLNQDGSPQHPLFVPGHTLLRELK